MALTEIPIELSSTPGIVDNSNATAITIDSSENVGIGTASPTGNLEIATSAADTGVDLILDGNRTSNGGIGSIVFNNNGDSVGMIRSNRASANDAADMLFYTQATGGANAERMRIDASGNTTFKANNSAVGPIVTLENTATAVNGQAWGSIHFDSNDTSTSASGTRASIVGTSTSFNGDGNLTFSTAPANGSNTERMRLDSSGNLLVGTTDSTPYNNTTGGGFVVASSGLTSIARETTASNQAVLHLNNTGVDGILAEFAKDGSTVGSIGTHLNRVHISSDAAGLFIDGGGTPSIYPWKSTATTSGDADSEITLGDASNRFKDLYLSGGAFLGGTAAANKLDDYEEGTWTPQVNFGGSDNGVTYGTRTGRYTKIGRMVYLSFNILLSSKGSQTGQVTISGAPFGNYAGSQNNASPIICEGNGSSFPDAFGMMWNDNQIYVRYQGANTKLPVYESNFTNSTQIFGMMQYET